MAARKKRKRKRPMCRYAREHCSYGPLSRKRKRKRSLGAYPDPPPKYHDRKGPPPGVPVIPLQGLPGSPTYRLRMHIGPLKAEQRSVTRQLKRAGVKVHTLGTEDVYFDVKANSCEDAQMRAAKALQQKGLRRMSTRMWAASCKRRSR